MHLCALAEAEDQKSGGHPGSFLFRFPPLSMHRLASNPVPARLYPPFRLLLLFLRLLVFCSRLFVVFLLLLLIVDPSARPPSRLRISVEQTVS